jgi:hypothetical protein
MFFIIKGFILEHAHRSIRLAPVDQVLCFSLADYRCPLAKQRLFRSNLYTKKFTLAGEHFKLSIIKDAVVISRKNRAQQLFQ